LSGDTEEGNTAQKEEGIIFIERRKEVNIEGI
jgi:hypothetical protein